METYDDHEWYSSCCGKKWDDDETCPSCSQQSGWECIKCQDDIHVTVGSLDCDPLSFNIMRAVGDVLKFYRGEIK